MRRRISLLVAVISTAIVAAFVIPLLLLVRTLAEDRGMAAASQQASTVAALVASLHDDPRLAELLAPTLARSSAAVSVVLADGTVLGQSWPNAPGDPEFQRALAGEAFSARDDGGGRVYVPVLIDGGVAVTRASMSPDQLVQGVGIAWASIIALGLALALIAAAVGAEAGRRVSRPLQATSQAAHQLREGDLAARAPVAGPPETMELGRALNGLAERIEELLQAERSAVGTLAHRLRTPVTALRLEVENLHDPAVAAGLGEHVVALQAAIDAVVADARRPLREDLPGACDPVEVVGARVDYWRPLAEDQGRRLRVDLAPAPLRVPVSALQLADVVDICIDNVFAHTDEGVEFAVSLQRAGDELVLRISDAGPGFPAVPSQPRPGTSGMGLGIARRVAEQAGGSVHTSTPGQPGAEVEVRLPLSA